METLAAHDPLTKETEGAKTSHHEDVIQNILNSKTKNGKIDVDTLTAEEIAELMAEEENPKLTEHVREKELERGDALIKENQKQTPPEIDQTKLEPFTQAKEKASQAVNELKGKIDGLEDDIRDFESKMAIDFGPDKEFFHLYGKCFSVDSSEYTYELCPFDKVDQKARHGGSTNLGRWHETPDWKADHREMSYTGGLKCWGGPDRSTKVTLTCGSENKVSDPAEPNKCEYSLKLQTPAVCSQRDYDELSRFIERFGRDDE